MTKINIVKIHGDLPFIHPPLRKPAVERPFLQIPAPPPLRDIDGGISNIPPKSPERGVAVISNGDNFNVNKDDGIGRVNFTI